MARELYMTESAFRSAFIRCDEILSCELPMSLQRVLFGDDARDETLQQTLYTQPVVFAVEYALADLFDSWGIRPDIVLGHSVGEYVAACRAGVFSLQDALRLISARAHLMQELPQNGAMAVVFAAEAPVRAAIHSYEGLVSVAAVNGPENVVISGERHAISSIVVDLARHGVGSCPLDVSHAFHS